jgi:hypothetical protein
MKKKLVEAIVSIAVVLTGCGIFYLVVYWQDIRDLHRTEQAIRPFRNNIKQYVENIKDPLMTTDPDTWGKIMMKIGRVPSEGDILQYYAGGKASIKGQAIVLFKDSYITCDIKRDILVDYTEDEQQIDIPDCFQISSDYSLRLLDKAIQPTSVDKVRTAVWITERYITYGTYSGGFLANGAYVEIKIVDLERRMVVDQYNVKGDEPPKSVPTGSGSWNGKSPRKKVAEILNSLPRVP